MTSKHKMKCPRCGGDAYIFEEERRKKYNCVTCGDINYMKSVQQIVKDKK